MSTDSKQNGLAEAIPKEVALQHDVLPLDVNGEFLKIGAMKALSAKTKKELCFLRGPECQDSG